MKRKSQSAQNSSGHPKRPFVAPFNQVWHRSERNHVPRSWLTEEDVRRVVREELERAMSHWAEYFQRDNDTSMAKSDVRNLQLQLPTKLSLPIFTGKKIEGEEGARICVALIDANTGDVIRSGPEFSIKLEIVVLEGDFNKGDQDNWAPEEFDNYVVKERAGKRPLLTGDLFVTLKGGVAELGDLIFTDNSSWNRSKRFRIGLKVASGYCGNTRIREAVTDAFRVKEHRGELYKKHYPPASDDKVWRLEKIAKDGKSLQKLSDAGIHKVEDFLLQLFTDSKKLKEILGKSITPTSWDVLVHHAMTCKTNWKLYLYYLDGTRKHGAVFNIDGQLIGLIKDRVSFPTHRLSAQEKEHGDAIVKKALANWNDVREFSGETFSDSMQCSRSSSCSSQVIDGQIEILNPVQCYFAPSIFAAPVGPEAPLANVGSTAEGHNGATALALPIQSQNTNSGNDMKLPVEETVHLAAQQPKSADPLNVLIRQGDNIITSVGLPIQSQNTNSGNAVKLSVDESVHLPAQQPKSTDQCSNSSRRQ